MGPFASLSQEANVTMMLNTILKLQATVEELRASGEQVKTSIEELKSSGVEVKTSIEELKSSGEEVKTSIEELKSSGEEVKTSIEELKSSGEEVKDRVARMQTENEEQGNKTEKLDHKLSREVEVLRGMGSECLDLAEQLREPSQEVYSCSQPAVQRCFQPSGSEKFINGGHKSKNSFSEVIPQIQQRNSKSDLYLFNSDVLRMSIIEGQLWVPVPWNHTIQILDPNASVKIKEISLTNIHANMDPISVHQTNTNQVLLAAGQGLYVLDINGFYLYKVVGGYITDVVLMSNKAFVYNYTDNSVVTVGYSSGQWVVINTFTASRSSRGSDNTITLLDNKIYLCSSSSDTIQSYTTTGTFVNTYGVGGSNSPGQLQYPWLCGTDSQGSLLVCDRNNHCLQVLSPGGTWRVYVLPGVRYPYDVVVDTGGNLWVLWQGGHVMWFDINRGKFKISKFSV